MTPLFIEVKGTDGSLNYISIAHIAYFFATTIGTTSVIQIGIRGGTGDEIFYDIRDIATFISLLGVGSVVGTS